MGYIKISYTHAHTHTLTYSLPEREWSEQSKRCVIDHKTEKKTRIKQVGKKAAVAVDASQWTDWQRTDESPSTIARLRPRWSHHHDEPLRPLGHTPIGPAWGHWAMALGVHGHLPSLKMIQLDFWLAKSWLETAISAFQLQLTFSCCPYANDLHSAYADLSVVRVRSVSNGSPAKKVINTESTWPEYGLLCSTCPAWAWTWPIFWRATRKELWLGRGVPC